MSEAGAVSLSNWGKGVNNLAPDYSLPEGFVRTAANVDILPGGKITSREGFIQQTALTNAHSLASIGSAMVYVNNGVLTTVNRNLGVIATKANIQGAVSYCAINGELYFVASNATGIIDTSGNIRALGVETPMFQPTPTVGTGILNAGNYMVAVTYISATGEESGCDQNVVVSVPANGGVTLSNFPMPVDTTISAYQIYFTDADSTILRRWGRVPIGTASVVLSSSQLGSPLRTHFMSPMPPGSAITFAEGRTVVSSGIAVFFSEPFRLGLTNNPDFLLYPAPPTLLWGTPNGLYVATPVGTYFVTKLGSEESSQKLVLPYGAVKGTLAELPNEVGAMWMSTRGVVKADGQGNIENVSEGKVSPAVASSGAAIIREANGVRNYIGVGDAPVQGTSFAATAFFNAEVIRANTTF